MPQESDVTRRSTIAGLSSLTPLDSCFAGNDPRSGLIILRSGPSYTPPADLFGGCLFATTAERNFASQTAGGSVGVEALAVQSDLPTHSGRSDSLIGLRQDGAGALSGATTRTHSASQQHRQTRPSVPSQSTSDAGASLDASASLWLSGWLARSV
jgi:hypothetical protein